MDQSQDNVDVLIRSLEDNGIRTVILKSKEEVVEFLQKSVTNNATVGLGDSALQKDLSILNILKEKGSRIYYAYDGSSDYNRNMDTFEEQPQPEYYITLDSQITENGQVASSDYYSETAAGAHNFPKHVIAFAAIRTAIDNIEASFNKIKRTIIEPSQAESDMVVALLNFSY